MTPERTADAVMAAYRELKEKVCAERGPTDCIDVLHVWHREKAAMVPFLSRGVHPTETIPVTMAIITEDHGPILMAAFGCESYVKRAPEGGDLSKAKRGDFQREFEERPDTDVVECLTVYLADIDGASVLRVAPYHYGDGGRLVWEEYHLPDADGVSGALIDALTEGLSR